MGQRRTRYKGHRMARQQPYASPGSTWKIPP